MRSFVILRINKVKDDETMKCVYDYRKSSERIVVKGVEGLEQLRKECSEKYKALIFFRYMEIKL